MASADVTSDSTSGGSARADGNWLPTAADESFSFHFAHDLDSIGSVRLARFEAASAEATESVAPDPAPKRAQAASQAGAPSAVCDIDDAVGFAVRRAAGKAAAKGVAIATGGEEGLSAVCEQQAGRRLPPGPGTQRRSSDRP